MLKKINLFLCGLSLSTAAAALELTETSAKGHSFKLMASADKWTRAVKVAKVCSDEMMSLKMFKLWMPDHGHGSTPTKISKIDDYCALVEKINFVMGGEWELRLVTEDGDKVTFTVDVD